MLHHQGAKNDLFKDLGHVFYLLCLFHILVPVYIGVDLHPEQCKTEMIKGFIIKGHGSTVYLLNIEGKQLDIIEHHCDILIDREGDPSRFEHLPEIHLFLNHLHEFFHDSVNPLPGGAVPAPYNKGFSFVTSLSHLRVERDRAEERNLEFLGDTFPSA